MSFRRTKRKKKLSAWVLLMVLMKIVMMANGACSGRLTEGDDHPGRIFLLTDAAHWLWHQEKDRSMSYLKTPLMPD